MVSTCRLPRAPRRAHWGSWSSRDAVLRRRMVRRFDPDRPGARRGRRATWSRWPCAPRAPGSARAGTSSPCSTRPTGTRSGRPPTTARPPDAWRAASRPAPALVLCLRDQDAYLDRYAAARQGLDRPVDRPLAGALLGHRRRPWRRWSCCSPPTTRASARCSSGCRRSGTTRSTRRSASPTTAASSGVVALGREAERVSGSPRTRRRRPLDDVLHVGRFGTTECREVMRQPRFVRMERTPVAAPPRHLIDPEPSPTRMAKRSSTPPPADDFAERIVDIDVEEEMRSAFLEYSYSVIYSRALPDARDGLKPVQRRILYGMSELGLRPDRAAREVQRVVGEVMGKYHPHGDQAIYDALVRMAQPFTMRLPLVDGHGNFGSLDDGPAASRYTEARMAPAALLMVGRPRRGHRRLRPQLRRLADPARRAAGRLPQPARQRRLRHRGRHGHQHGPAQPRRGHRRGPAPHRPPRRAPSTT